MGEVLMGGNYKLYGVSYGVCEPQGIAGYQIEIQCHVHGSSRIQNWVDLFSGSFVHDSRGVECIPGARYQFPSRPRSESPLAVPTRNNTPLGDVLCHLTDHI